nr:ribonuclease H-like domain-containing protein [Tanacetum cinerariifolium]
MAGDAGGSGLELATQLANLLQQNGNLQPSNKKLSDNLQISIKLNSQNYALWTRMIRVAIGAGNLTEYPTAKALWDDLVVTYNSGKDKLQTFNLHVKATELKQGDISLEVFWIALQGVWGEIVRIDPNPMKCKEDIQTYTKIRSEQKLFHFLNGLDRKFEPIKREILRVDPLPTAEAAYAMVRKEAAHQNILGVTNETHGIATGLIAGETDGMGQCFKIIGYPDWWTDGHKTASNKGAKKYKPSTSPTTNTRNSTKNRNDRRSEGGFEGVAAAVREEGEESFSDIKTGRIIGRVTERDGLYYVDEVVQSGTVMLAHGTTKREAWLWHTRLGHPSYYYSPQHSGQGKEQGDPLIWLSYTSTATIGNEIKNHSTTSAEAPNISATNEHPVPDMISGEREEEVPKKYVLPPRSNRRVPPKRYSLEKTTKGAKYPMANIAEGNLSNNAKAFAVSLCSEEIPSSFEQALKSEKWKKAMDDEMKALKKNKTWDQYGTVERYKARLVAKGHTQTHGIDYLETFFPVEKMDTIRVLLSVASNQGWPIHRFDVKNAFLHGELKEEVYMEAPPGFSEHFKHGEACRLKKSLYGLKQSPRAWFGRFTLAMKRYGVKQSNSDHTLFLKNRKNHVACLIIYVDDMVIIGNDEEEIKRLKEGLVHARTTGCSHNAALRIVRYLKGTAGHGVLFRSNGYLNIQMYTYADWAGDKGNRRLTSGYFSLVGGNLVTWRRKKQKVVSLSSSKAEFKGIAKGLAEALWIRKLVSEIG